MTHLNRLLNAFRPSQPVDLDAEFYPGEPDDTEATPEFVSITRLLSVATLEERAVVLALHHRLTQEPPCRGRLPMNKHKNNNANDFIYDGMGALAPDLKHSFIDVIVEPGQPAPLEGITAADVAQAFIPLGKPSGVLASRLQAIREAQSDGPAMDLTLKDLSTHLFMFGETGTGMTASHQKSLAEDFTQDPPEDA